MRADAAAARSPASRASTRRAAPREVESPTVDASLPGDKARKADCVPVSTTALHDLRTLGFRQGSELTLNEGANLGASLLRRDHVST